MPFYVVLRKNLHNRGGEAYRLRNLSHATVRVSGLSEPVCTLSVSSFLARSVANEQRETL